MISPAGAIPLEAAVTPGRDKLHRSDAVSPRGEVDSHTPELVILAAGQGTRFEQAPRCMQQ